jgi:galactose-1-phosphate uridylyltransferase
MSITQNHLPGAGGSLVHPHLQVHATKQISDNHRVLEQRVQVYETRHGNCILSDLLKAEKKAKERDIDSTGAWEWIAAFAPWVGSDFTGFEIASGEMATLTFPEFVAAMAKKFWNIDQATVREHERTDS